MHARTWRRILRKSVGFNKTGIGDMFFKEAHSGIETFDVSDLQDQAALTGHSHHGFSVGGR